MALSRKHKIIWEQREGGEQVDALRSPSFNPQRIVRWVAVPGVSAAVGLWLIGTMAGLSSVGASLSATSGGLQQTLSMPGSLAMADPLKQHFLRTSAPFVLANAHGGAQALHDHAVQCGASCFKLAGVSPQMEKSARLVAHAKPEQPILKSKAQERFERMEASLSPTKLAAAFAGADKPVAFATAGMPVATANARPVISSTAPQIAEASLVPSAQVMASLSDDMPAPAAERFARADTVVQTAPAPQGFAQPETPDNAQLALALVRSLPVEDEAFASPLPMTDSSADVAVSPVETQQEQPGDAAALPDALTDDVPLPTRRPQFDAPQPKAVEQDKPEPQPKIAQPKLAQQKPAPQAKPVQQARQPARQGRDGGDVLAYAKPDTPSGGLGQAFRNLFNGPNPGSGAGHGVAVYDISAKTVYMPDGQRLEAHSGLGAMVDQPRYVHVKDRGPTPPNTYNLSLRESRFHGVEALRLTPVGGGNKYNRNGLLAHTYMLRGGRAESNGCVVFRDYARFLAAFKKGKITRLVVVPRLNGSPTQVATDNARGA
ncbi:DUF2778 domain-containing protein [Mesorhizobium loti]|uniref:DUF2778 domain-containing protein n=1 Tax=Mesorhizobium loti R88b TaxID=935548 RepID=A0A6M7WKX1_RHILI|nr:DUF2778 domain-containing protein [Mesorhizobium loti]QKD02306.1 DUF2778 domain-containing protein [Mesorhizobium loti R88b]